MTRTEKSKIKSKIKSRIKLFSILTFLSIIVFVSLIVIYKYFITLVDGSHIPISLVISILVSIFLFMIFWRVTLVYSNKFDVIKYKNKIKRNDFHFKLFWELLQNKKYEDAKKFYNTFPLGQHRAFCEGLIMGMVYVNGADKTWKHTVVERMNTKLS